MNILIIGATSAIAQAIAKIYAKNGDNLFLVARNSAKLNECCQDLQVKYATKIKTFTLDLNLINEHPKYLSEALAYFQNIDIAVIAHGTLPNQKECEISTQNTLQELSTNAISTIGLLTELANIFEKQRQGTIAVISSVAGDRGRQSNYVYGSAKSMVTTFCQGLRNRLQRSHVNVLTIKPGFVDTPMTANFKKSPLWASPDSVAKDIVKAIRKRKYEVYTPWFWSLIMLIIKLIPERIFIKLKL